MTKLTYSQTANLLLVVALLALLGAFPFRQHFAGGLVTAMGSAGLIAGLADWFAVTALFRRPLGLPYPSFIPTAIVPRNRERLLEALVSLVEEDLLTKESLRKHVDETDLAGLLLDYGNQPAVKAHIWQTLEQTLDYLLTEADQEALRNWLSRLLEQHLDPQQFKGLIAEIIRITQAKGFDDRVLTLLMDEVLRSLDYEQLHHWLIDVLEGALVRYNKGLTRRHVAGNLLINAFADADSPRFRRELRQAVNLQLGQLHRQAKLWLTRLADGLAGEPAEPPAWVGDLCKTLSKLLTSQVQLSPEILKGIILGNLQELWAQTVENPAAREGLNNRLQSYLAGLIDTRHHLLGELIRENLYRFDALTLTQFVEDKAGKDLQVIRISGTLVGSGVGALLYLLTFWLGGY